MSGYNFTENEIKEMFEISKLAFNALMGATRAEISGSLGALDDYIGEEISKELWDKLDK